MINTKWFIDRLRDLGISQRELGRRIGMDASAVNLMIHGKRSISAEEAARIADILNLPLEEVLRRAGIVVSSQTETVEIKSLIDESMVLHPRPGRSRVPAPAGGAALSAARVENSASQFFGWTFFYTARKAVDADVIGRLCVVKLRDGSEKIRFIKPSIDRQSYRLIGLDGLPEEDAPVIAASPILWIQA